MQEAGDLRLVSSSVKPVPPLNVSVSSSEELSSILKLTWVNPSINKFISLKYDIQYRARGTAAWTQVPALPAVLPHILSDRRVQFPSVLARPLCWLLSL